MSFAELSGSPIAPVIQPKAGDRLWSIATIHPRRKPRNIICKGRRTDHQIVVIVGPIQALHVSLQGNQGWLAQEQRLIADHDMALFEKQTKLGYPHRAQGKKADRQ